MSTQDFEHTPHEEILGRLEQLEKSMQRLIWILVFYVFFATIFIAIQ